MQTIAADIRHATRVLSKAPSFTTFAVLALALGMGATTAMFGLIDAVLLRPLQFRDSARLVEVFEDSSFMGFPRDTPAPANFADWKRRNHVFEDMAAENDGLLNITGGSGAPEEVQNAEISANLLPLLGVHPLLGRNFRSEENHPNPPKLVLLSYGVWQRRFGGDPNVAGKTIELDRETHHIVGVMPGGFQFPERIDLWRPAGWNSAAAGLPRSSHFLHVFARLKPGISVAAAQREMSGIASQLARELPKSNTNIGAVVVSLRDQFVGDLKLGLFVLLGGVGSLLIIACANVAGLLLARGTARQRELAVRAAIGATRTVLIRQALVESLLLSLAGGALGCLIAAWALQFLRRLVPDAMTATAQAQLDGKALLFTFLVSTASAVAFGIVPALAMSRVDLNVALQQGGRSGIGAGRRARRWLVAGEVALATVPLVGTLLLAQTLWNLSRVPLGFDPEHVLTARTSLPLSDQSPYRNFAARSEFYRRVIEHVEAIPGVRSAGYTTFLPLTNRGGTSGFAIEGRPAPRAGEFNDANHRVVSNGYLQTIGVRLRTGRFFNSSDRAGSEPVAIINEAMARQYWKGEDPLGKRLRLAMGDSDPWLRIVGVVDSVRQMGLDLEGRAEMYFPATQEPTSFGYFAPRDLAVRVSGDPSSYANAVRQAVWAVDKNQPVIDVKPMRSFVEEELASRDTQMQLIGVFAAISLLFAALGLYALLAFTVAQRVREIGVKMALGARQAQVMRETLVDGLRLVFAGLIAGLGASWLLARVVKSMLYGVAAGDAVTFLAAACVLTLSGVAACYFPARAAAAVDPMEALRYE